MWELCSQLALGAPSIPCFPYPKMPLDFGSFDFLQLLLRDKKILTCRAQEKHGKCPELGPLWGFLEDQVCWWHQSLLSSQSQCSHNSLSRSLSSTWKHLKHSQGEQEVPGRKTTAWKDKKPHGGVFSCSVRCWDL